MTEKVKAVKTKTVTKPCLDCGDTFSYETKINAKYELAYCVPCEMKHLGIVEGVADYDD